MWMILCSESMWPGASEPTLTPTDTPTPTSTQSPTLTPTNTSTLSPTPTVTPTLAHGGQTVVLQQGVAGYTGCEDTSILEWEPNTNFGNDGWLKVRSGGWESALIRFDLTSLGANPQIESATLSMYVVSRSNENSMTTKLYQLLRPWTEDEASWNQAGFGSPWSSPGALAVGVDRSHVLLHTTTLNATMQWLSWDIAALVTQWATNPTANHGLILTGEGTGGVEYRFCSSEYEWGQTNSGRSWRYVTMNPAHLHPH